jgi:hypothetical protein
MKPLVGPGIHSLFDMGPSMSEKNSAKLPIVRATNLPSAVDQPRSRPAGGGPGVAAVWGAAVGRVSLRFQG